MEASSSKNVKNSVDLEVSTDLEPGACTESILVTTESFEEFASQMSRSLEEKNDINGKISEIKNVISEDVDKDGANYGESEDNMKQVQSSASLQSDEGKLDTVSNSSDSDDYLHNAEWLNKEKHVFILSSAGKPVYSRYGNEDKLAGLCGVIQALVSVVQDSRDVLRSINTPTCTAVFLVKGPLILAAVSKSNESETQLVLQLTYAYNQIVSVLTQSQLTRIFEQRRNYDLRRLLSGAERLIDHLLNFMEKEPAVLLGAVRCLPLAANIRDTITNTIISACSKVKDLVFAILIAGNQLITLVSMKKYSLHPSDIHLIFNLVRSSESFKTAESWTPICLPKFDSSGFLHAHVSYLAEDCQACLLLLTVQRDAFYALSQAKQNITEKLRRSNCLVAINESVQCSPSLPTTNPLVGIGVPEIRHFMYKCRNNAQLFTSDVADYGDKKDKARNGPDILNSIDIENLSLNSPSDITKLPKMKDVDYISKYRKACSQIHNTARPAKLIYEANSEETILAWITTAFELYITFDSLIEKSKAIYAVDKLLRWVKKEEDRLFIMTAPTF